MMPPALEKGEQRLRGQRSTAAGSCGQGMEIELSYATTVAA